MKLKRNLMIGANIFAGGTDVADIPEHLRSQVPQAELEGEPDTPPPPAAMPPLRRLKLEQLVAIATERGLKVTEDMTRLQIIEQIEALG